MMTLHAEADGGSLAIGFGGFVAHYLLNGGDGSVDIRVFDSENEFDTHTKEATYRKYDFVGFVSGDTIEIYDYDCGGNVLAVLSGRYAIYMGEHGYNKVAIVKWE